MRKAAEILSSLLNARVRSQGKAYSSLFSGWGRLVGLSLAEHSRVVELRRGILLVQVDHPGWMQMLHLRRREILRRLRGSYSQLAVRDIKVTVSPSLPPVEPAPPAAAGGRGKDQAVGGEMEEVEKAVSGVQPAELRRSLRLLLLQSVQRRRNAGGRDGGGQRGQRS